MSTLAHPEFVSLKFPKRRMPPYTHPSTLIPQRSSLNLRTTLILEFEIAERLRQEAALKKRSFKRIVNDALAKGLYTGPTTAG